MGEDSHRAELHLGGGKTLTVITEGNPAGVKNVAAFLNGEELSGRCLSARQLSGGGELLIRLIF